MAPGAWHVAHGGNRNGLPGAERDTGRDFGGGALPDSRRDILDRRRPNGAMLAGVHERGGGRPRGTRLL